MNVNCKYCGSNTKLGKDRNFCAKCFKYYDEESSKNLTLIQAISSGRPFKRIRQGKYSWMIFKYKKEPMLIFVDSGMRAKTTVADFLSADWEIQK